jgi:hypothetical protein
MSFVVCSEDVFPDVLVRSEVIPYAALRVTATGPGKTSLLLYSEDTFSHCWKDLVLERMQIVQRLT